MQITNSSQYISKLLPHAYPMLLVDRIINYAPGKITVKKNLTFNEPFFQGHFPTEPIVPGVLMVEMAAQSAALMYILDGLDIEDENGLLNSFDMENLSSKVGYLASIKNVKFLTTAGPGDVLKINCRTKSATDKFRDVEFKITTEEVVAVSEGRISVTQR